MKDHTFRQAGFTLIELMMVMVIIMILFGGSITAYLNFNKSQVVNNDVRNLSTEIYRVRTLAATLQYPTGCSSLKSYTIQSTEVNNVLSGVIVSANCDPTDVVSPAKKILLGSIFSAPFSLVFSPGSGYLKNGTEETITIKNINDATVSKVLTVEVYGTMNSN